MPPTPVGEVAAEGPQERAERRADGDERGGVDLADRVLVAEEDRQEGGEPDERPERHGVEAAQAPGVAFAQDVAQVARADRGGGRGRLLGQQRERHPHQGHRDQREAEHRVPAVRLGQARGEERREHGAGVAGARDPHRQALALRRVVAAGERQRDGEARAGDAEQDADAEQRAVGGGEVPAGDQRDDHEGHRDQADAARAVAVAEQAERDAEDGGGQQRHGHQQALG